MLKSKVLHFISLGNMTKKIAKFGNMSQLSNPSHHLGAQKFRNFNQLSTTLNNQENNLRHLLLQMFIYNLADHDFGT